MISAMPAHGNGSVPPRRAADDPPHGGHREHHERVEREPPGEGLAVELRQPARQGADEQLDEGQPEDGPGGEEAP
ncbi:hypothetical protein LRS13_09610 [Svornostia abyssi]|uniref:Uncharacterized protein n=1 Tax=Svornostia abyssi TaxID=2898438 RepID=A0ABY5PMJ7_9ACTN|nr:hypothetical protein LRS13_09610 [Parviterribacteraceae bacterium J379]